MQIVLKMVSVKAEKNKLLQHRKISWAKQKANLLFPVLWDIKSAEQKIKIRERSCLHLKLCLSSAVNSLWLTSLSLAGGEGSWCCRDADPSVLCRFQQGFPGKHCLFSWSSHLSQLQWDLGSCLGLDSSLGQGMHSSPKSSAFWEASLFTFLYVWFWGFAHLTLSWIYFLIARQQLSFKICTV